MTVIEAETAEETTETTEAETASTRSQMAKHEGFVEWYQNETGEDMSTFSPAETIAEFARLRNDFRRSDFYLEQWGPEARAAAAEKREAERAIAAEKRAAEKAARAAERAAKAEAEGEEGEPKAKRTPKKRAVKRVARKTVETDETEAAEDSSEDEVFA